MRVLIAEDERDLNNIITKKLTLDGFAVDSTFDGLSAIDYINQAEYDIIILDVMMPGLDGFEVLDKMRASGNSTPVIFLTARDSVKDRVKGLDSGANDYLIKPFAFEELMARIRVLSRENSSSQTSVLKVGDLELDTAQHRVRRGGKEIELSSKEFAFLEYMMVNAEIVLSRETIEDHVWNFDYEGGSNVVDVYISYLRKKIDDDFETKLIHTIRGKGYVLRQM